MTEQLKIEKSDDWQGWDDYVLEHPHGTLYHLNAWKNAIEKSFEVTAEYRIGKLDNKICGILPIFTIKNLFGQNKIVSIPYAVYGGILADNSTVEQKLLDHTIHIAKENHINHIEFRCLHNAGYELLKQELYITFITSHNSAYALRSSQTRVCSGARHSPADVSTAGFGEVRAALPHYRRLRHILLPFSFPEIILAKLLIVIQAYSGDAAKRRISCNVV